MENELNEEIKLTNSFYGVYILYNINPKYKGSVYIGFTVNPERRIRQHNREIKGGALKTGNNRGPWDMVLIIHGFRTRCAALQFEWAWQNPKISKRLSHLANKARNESVFAYKIRILSEMFNVGPWKRLPLTIQWLKQDYICDFPIRRPPPMHIPIAYGNIESTKIGDKVIKAQHGKDHVACRNSESKKDKIFESQHGKTQNLSNKVKCLICNLESTDESVLINCIVEGCTHTSHVKCLADLFLKQSKENDDYIIPILGTCPLCKETLMWGDILKQKKHSVETQSDDSEYEKTDEEMSDDQFM
uniref:Structure-specific endonuclease subunit SLX1 homolog n=1 Tax=Hydra vulgaris TaxID=6087 RepID=T2M722_HYDVU|nr:unnamed protein product [Hydra vulgaris]